MRKISDARCHLKIYTRLVNTTFNSTILGLNTAPVIINLPTGRAVPENSGGGRSLYTVSFTDVDVNQSHSFSAVFNPPTAASYFNISQGLILFLLIHFV